MAASIRIAREADAAQMLAIYAPIVEETAVSFELTPPRVAEFAVRIRTVLTRNAWLACEDGERILGYAYATEFRSRAAYQWAVELAVYVAAASRRRGIARGLGTALLGCLAVQGYRRAIGAIALPNEPSVRLMRSLGFRPAGVLSTIGYKHGSWHDVEWWGRTLVGDEHPAPPRSMGDVADTLPWRDAIMSGQACLT